MCELEPADFGLGWNMSGTERVEGVMCLLRRSVRLDEVASMQMDEAPTMIVIVGGLVVLDDGVLAPRAEHFRR